MSKRFRICLFVWIAVVVAFAFSNQLHAQVTEITPVPEAIPEAPLPAADVYAVVPNQEWVISIVPAATTTSPAQPLPQAAADYKRVYDSIPFNRAQYNANPNYRHDSTMEILTGNARHKTVVTHSTTPRVTVRSPRPIVTYPNQFGYVRPAAQFNYYRHFPSLNPYVNIWNFRGAF